MTKTELLDPLEKHPELVEYRKADAAIQALVDQFGMLEVANVEDEDGAKACHDARITVKTKRVEISKRGKELRAEATAYGKAVIAEEKRLIELIKPLEQHLQDQENIVAKEKERQEEYKRQARIKLIEGRMKELQALGVAKLEVELDAMTQIEYADELAKAKEAHEQRQAELAELEAEKARQAEVKAEQDRIAAEQKAEQDRIDEANRKLREAADAEAAKERAIEENKRRKEEHEKAIKEAAELAAQQERERIEREAFEENERTRIEEQERLAEEAAKPYRKKLQTLADQIDALHNPPGKHHDAVAGVLCLAIESIIAIAKKR